MAVNKLDSHVHINYYLVLKLNLYVLMIGYSEEVQSMTIVIIISHFMV